MNELQRVPIHGAVPIMQNDAQSLWHELYGKPRSLQNRRAEQLTDRRELGAHGHGDINNCRPADRRRLGTRGRRAGTTRTWHVNE